MRSSAVVENSDRSL